MTKRVGERKPGYPEKTPDAQFYEKVSHIESEQRRDLNTQSLTAAVTSECGRLSGGVKVNRVHSWV